MKNVSSQLYYPDSRGSQMQPKRNEENNLITISHSIVNIIKEKIKGAISREVTQEGKLSLPYSRLFSDAHSATEIKINLNTIIFRVLIWQDMLRKLWSKKAFFGMDFGWPLRSKSIEITGMGFEAWSRDGWIFPHNSYLHIIYRSGIIGVILLTILFMVIWRIVKKSVTEKLIIGILFSGIIVYWLAIGFTLMLFELPYHAIPFWALFGLTFAYLYKDNLDNDESKK
jgi:hypothetical protein